MKSIFTFIALLVAQIVLGQGDFRSIDSLLNNLYEKGRINGNVLIADKGKIVYNKSFGLANESTKENLNENSVFHLASVTKQFTAVSIALLKEQGKLNYEDHISNYIPELSFYEGVTIKHLLQHTGGLADYMKLFEKSFDSNKIATNNDIVKYFSKEKPEILFEPGQQWRYSNTGYALLAIIIERVSGLKYGDFLSKNIFNPLKMKSTFVQEGNSSKRKIKNLANSYTYSDSLKSLVLTSKLEEFNYAKMFGSVIGDGGVFSTVIDLLKWNRALVTDILITSEGKREMFTPAILSDGSSFDYGYGWQLDSNKDFGTVVSHTGGWEGYLTLNELHVDTDKTIIILFNHEGAEIVNKKVRYALYGLSEPNPTGKKEISLTSEQLNKVVGVYQVRPGMEFSITLNGGEPYGSITDQTPLRIYPENETSFFFREINAAILFEKDQNGVISKLTFSQGEQGEHKIEAKKIK